MRDTRCFFAEEAQASVEGGDEHHQSRWCNVPMRERTAPLTCLRPVTKAPLPARRNLPHPRPPVALNRSMCGHCGTDGKSITSSFSDLLDLYFDSVHIHVLCHIGFIQPLQVSFFVRPAGNWKNAGGPAAVVLYLSEVLLNALVCSIPDPKQDEP